MKAAEVAKVLAKCAAYDQRTIGEVDVLAWLEILDTTEFTDGLEAVTRHYRTSGDRAMPADILRHAGDAKRDRQRREHQHQSPALALPSRFEPEASTCASPAFERAAETRAQMREQIKQAQRKAEDARRAFATADDALNALDDAIAAMGDDGSPEAPGGTTQ